MKYSLGAIQYFWPKEVVQSFYKDVADDAGVDIVYLGETVCQKRTELRFADYMDIAHQLREAGKTVCLSTMTLLEAPALVRDLVDRKSTRLNSSHVKISYAVFCLKKKNIKK